MLRRALAFADFGVREVRVADATPLLVLPEGVTIEGGIAILVYLQDLTPKLRPLGFDRYRIAEWLNTISTEVTAPTILMSQGALPAEKHETLAASVKRQIDLLTEKFSSAFFLGKDPCIADFYLEYAMGKFRSSSDKPSAF